MTFIFYVPYIIGYVQYQMGHDIIRSKPFKKVYTWKCTSTYFMKFAVIKCSMKMLFIK